MKKTLTFTFLLMVFILTGCTENERARAFGGTANVTLECGQKLFDVTWKDIDLWYATRPMRDDETPEVYKFEQKSAFGVWEGSVTFTEC